MANYPTSAPSFTAKSAGQTVASAHINSLQDETAAIGAALIATLQHDVKTAAGKRLYENGRTVAVGEWTASAYASTNFFCNDAATWQVNASTAAVFRWMKIGFTAFVHLGITTSTLAAASTTTTQLRFNLPSGLVPAQNGQVAARWTDPTVGAPETAEVVLSSGSAVAILRRNNVVAAWTNGIMAGTLDFSFETST